MNLIIRGYEDLTDDEKMKFIIELEKILSKHNLVGNMCGVTL